MRNLPTLAGRRAVIVTPNLSLVGDTEVYLQRLLRVQQSLGINVRVVTAAAVDPAPDSIEVMPCPEVFADSVFSRPALALADELIGWADWVEFHHDAPPALLYALKDRLPRLLFMHTARYTCAAKSRYLPRSGGCCETMPDLACWRNQWRQGCLTTIDGRPSMQVLFKAAALRRSSRSLAAAVTKVVFNSNALRQLFERTIGRIGDRARILPPPMVMPEHQPRPRGGDLLYLGRFFEQKGINDAVRVAAALPGKRLDLYGAGRGEQAASRLACELNTGVRFHGWGTEATVALALAEAGCLLLPTRLFEAWGMVGP
ncbi:MAG: glycosyltransferase family 4 protein [Methylobacter sp.]